MKVHLDQVLLDRQIVDRDGRLIGKVDDIRLEVDETGVPYVAALLTGQVALGRRIGGRLGRLLVRAAERFTRTPPARPLEIPFHLVTTFDSAVQLKVCRDELPEPHTEAWLRRHLIDRIPGAGHAGK